MFISSARHFHLSFTPRAVASVTCVDPPVAKAARLASVMPSLAGQALQAPRFHKTNWIVGQGFTSEDDPDRTLDTWVPPPFVFKQDPILQSAKTTAEDLVLPNSSPIRFARVVRHAMSEQQCAELLRYVNDKGFTPALLNVGRGRQQLAPTLRDGHRIIVDSPELAAWLLEVLRPHLPDQMPDGSKLVDINERMRFLCYTPGQVFVKHVDGVFRRPSGHPRAGDRSRITLQFYLHSIPEKYGGATTFYPNETYCVKHQPEAGSVLLFTQNLLHEGSLVKDGLKYTIRTEAMYSSL